MAYILFSHLEKNALTSKKQTFSTSHKTAGKNAD